LKKYPAIHLEVLKKIVKTCHDNPVAQLRFEPGASLIELRRVNIMQACSVYTVKLTITIEM